MEQQCATWETCMNRDPATLGRARVGAELIAEVVNGFVEPISWKTLVWSSPGCYCELISSQAFTLTSLSFLTVFINALLSLYRARLIHPSAPPAQPPHYPIDMHPYGGYLSPAPTPAWGKAWKPIQDDADLETPTRRRRLEGGAAVKIK